jgi:hypothetical protein
MARRAPAGQPAADAQVVRSQLQLEGASLRVCWLGLFVTLISTLPTRKGVAQEHPLQWIGWNLPVVASTMPDPAAIAVPDSVRVRGGYQHWRGAALGAGIGGALGILTGAVAGGITSCDDCSQQPSAGTGALYGGLLGGGAGGVLGFLVGLSSPKYVWASRAETSQRRSVQQ